MLCIYIVPPIEIVLPFRHKSSIIKKILHYIILYLLQRRRNGKHYSIVKNVYTYVINEAVQKKMIDFNDENKMFGTVYLIIVTFNHSYNTIRIIFYEFQFSNVPI